MNRKWIWYSEYQRIILILDVHNQITGPNCGVLYSDRLRKHDIWLPPFISSTARKILNSFYIILTQRTTTFWSLNWEYEVWMVTPKNVLLIVGVTLTTLQLGRNLVVLMLERIRQDRFCACFLRCRECCDLWFLYKRRSQNIRTLNQIEEWS